MSRSPYERYGASGPVDLALRRARRHLREAVASLVRTLGAVRARRGLFWRTRHHRAFVSLGYNCELAFRYFRSHGFVDSGLLHWSYARSIDELIFVLEHLDLFFTGRIEGPKPLYRCANTHVGEHGKSAPEAWLGKPPEVAKAVIAADVEELRGRMAYLRGKFVKTLGDGGALVAYKIRTSEFLAPTGEEKVNRLLAALRRLGMREATILLVCEKACRGKSVRLDWPDVQVRYVDAFNPDDAVTDAEAGDPVGWRMIFSEFKPTVRKRQQHKFKFEK